MNAGCEHAKTAVQVLFTLYLVTPPTKGVSPQKGCPHKRGVPTTFAGMVYQKFECGSGLGSQLNGH